MKYFNKDTFCSVDIYPIRKHFYKTMYCSPIFLFEDRRIQELMEHDDNHVILSEAEQCRTNTWLWVVHSSVVGEAHFAIEGDILDAVSIIII